MQKSKPYTKQSYTGKIQFMVKLRYICEQRIRLIVCLILLLFILLHILQNGLFLMKHFTEDENQNNMIKLDMKTWQSLTSNQSHRKVPRYIHQIWISSRTNEKIYDNFRIAANACIELHPKYTYKLWTDKEILVLLKTHYSWFLPTYEKYGYDMQRVDAMKYVLLFHFGGIYIDLDIKCKIPDLITSMLPTDKRNFEPDIIFHMGAEGISANTDIMAAKQFHPFFKLAISQLKNANRWFYLYHLTIILSAGPTFLYGIYQQFPLKDMFYYVPNNLLYGKLIEGVGGGTWYGYDSAFLIRLMDNKIWSSFLMCVSIIILFLVWKVSQKKFY
ncbi:unnamed protein product [Rotaria socialis]|uniref:Uncharacterized protein n=1 Tax=Rotaria socialis TaxID=392032 RepID=A0A820SD75_9BILA|nr:unnamed protein product [Rotaria socialis]CAF3385956.1 unnamed protein product [Rotaria socialis]CAF3437345.1 unnamed protein product [Rotaria socialis]CAF4417941.1 unnamed protein product [Rotaria socialis]CAF4447929.1 unnamed protein product [Rotaria socialis]